MAQYLVFLHYKFYEPPQPRILNYDFVRIELFNHHMIATYAEGIVFDGKHLEISYKVFDQYYPNKAFGHVSNRLHDYRSVCCYSEASYQNAQFEKTFYDKSFKAFYRMKEAVGWIEVLLQKKAISTTS